MARYSYASVVIWAGSRGQENKTSGEQVITFSMLAIKKASGLEKWAAKSPRATGKR